MPGGALGWSRWHKQEDIDHVRWICQAREDIDLLEVEFSDVLEQPLTEFRKLRRQGVPIDHHKAAKAINPKYYRCRGAA